MDREAAYRGFVDIHLDRVYRLARAILRDQLEAQDATHDAFLQAWRHSGALRDPERFEPWFDRILVNTCRNRLRTRRVAIDISTEVALAAGALIHDAETRQVIGAALATLSPDQQIVVALRFSRDLPIAEIASRLRIAEGTVRSRLHYAVKRLKTSIQAKDSKETGR